MRLCSSLILACLSGLAASQAVVGKAEGFAAGVTGGGNAKPEYPKNIQELKTLLTATGPKVIVLDKTFDFTESEGQESGNVCAPWGTGDKCQQIIQANCDGKPGGKATWWKAARNPIDVASDKTILGVGNKGIIKGKGLRFRKAKNVIVQNIAITDLNHKYVWGGDALSFANADLIWIDHVTTARPGRQHYVFGFDPSHRITLSNNFIDGNAPYSTGCNGYHYWTFELVGHDDQITMKNNYIVKTAGRSPALSFKTLLHAVNNVWQDNNGHALEGGEAAARGIFEGNVFINVKKMVGDYKGRLFTSPDANTNKQCQSALGRACQTNILQNSQGSFSYKDTSFFNDFKGLSIAPAMSASEAAKYVPANAGAGKINVGTGQPQASNPAPTKPTTTKPAAPNPAPTKPSSPGTVPLYGQCGGQGWTGGTVCAKGKCVKANDWYSQCV
ncbi:putative pectin lyase C [Paramyrothecium foliicola]|nr:putative pectin lyase C [Paramyrothecium foliicola]